jgi:hypothetical protein
VAERPPIPDVRASSGWTPPDDLLDALAELLIDARREQAEAAPNNGCEK